MHTDHPRPAAHSVLDALQLEAVVIAPDGTVVETNAAWRSRTRAACAHVPHCGVGQPYLDSCPVRALEAAAAERLRQGVNAVLAGERPEAELDCPAAPNAPSWLAVRIAALPGDEHGALVTWTDITRHKQAEAALAHAAARDPLTELPNRTLFMDRLAHSLRLRGDRRVAVLFLDLDGFKLVNDRLGHLAGDELLVECARRLALALRPGDTLSRFGGDEFAVLCEQVGSEAAAVAVAERLLAALLPTVTIEGTAVATGASIGIALSRSGADADGLLREADSAMYLAKERGRGRAELYDEAQRIGARERLELEAGLRSALDRGELRLLFQPVVHIASGELRGVETLLRWQHPERGLLAPASFLPSAEAAGLLVRIGRWVMDSAVAQLADWHRRFPQSRIAVGMNLSPHEVAHPDILGYCADALARHGAEPEWFVVEVLEHLLVEDSELAQTLRGLSELGAWLTIDDFGTGSSSLSRLHRLPVHGIKIHGSFVAGLPDDPSNRAIVDATVRLATALGIRAIAEGVETRAQAEVLAELGCEMGQGHWYGMPRTARQIESILADGLAYAPALAPRGAARSRGVAPVG